MRALSNNLRTLIAAWSVLTLVVTGVSRAAPAKVDAAALTAEQHQFFETKVRPVLIEHCYKCHSAEANKSSGSLRLDTRDAIRAGGDSGPAVVPNDAAASLLLRAISHADPDLQMPPKKAKLPDTVIADLVKWIETGAADPREAEPRAQSVGGVTSIEAGREFWSFKKPIAHPPPSSSKSDWARGDLDAFVLSGMEAKSLTPSPDADSSTLLRRIYFDLIGMPPTPEQRAKFLDLVAKGGTDPAIETEVDALLATPQFGERWGRHWLDVARFAESSGKEANISFPYAFRYRDYVIDAVNADVPFDRFLTEQIAGDLLPADNARERARLLVATGFLAIGPKNLDEADAKQFDADLIDEQLDALTRATVGQSVACARCHDHKFDPFSMNDYYALAGVFASTKTFYGTFVTPSNKRGGDPLQLPAEAEAPIFHKSLLPAEVTKLKMQLEALNQEEKDRRAAADAARARGESTEKYLTLRDALRIFWQRGNIEGQLEKVDDEGRALPLAMGVQAKPAVDAAFLERGDVHRVKEPVPRGFPQVLPLTGTDIPSDAGGRLELARWLTHADNPLTARVMVNRVWHHVFGAGIVATVDNFGTTGEPPSHPQLLDTLAVQFVADGWSVKKLVRQFVLSRTYRQSSAYDEAKFRIDPENRLLWRMPKRRLDAEAIRDAMLAAAGDLDLQRPTGSLVAMQIGDRPVSLIGLDTSLPPDLDGSRNRSVYLPVLRDRLPDVLELFDFAEPSLVTGDREVTNVPIQALYLMNSGFVRDRALKVAQRVKGHTDAAARTRLVYQLCLSREPDAEELEAGLSFLHQQHSSDEILAAYCQAILATAEFRNLD